MGAKVKVHFTGKFEDGEVFDTSVGGKPIEYETGASQVIKCWEMAVMMMRKG